LVACALRFSRTIVKSSSEFPRKMLIDEKLVQIAQGRNAETRLAENQSEARSSIQHPFGNDPTSLSLASIERPDLSRAAQHLEL
jgi:hypothetical protein